MTPPCGRDGSARATGCGRRSGRRRAGPDRAGRRSATSRRAPTGAPRPGPLGRARPARPPTRGWARDRGAAGRRWARDASSVWRGTGCHRTGTAHGRYLRCFRSSVHEGNSRAMANEAFHTDPSFGRFGVSGHDKTSTRWRSAAGPGRGALLDERAGAFAGVVAGEGYRDGRGDPFPHRRRTVVLVGVGELLGEAQRDRSVRGDLLAERDRRGERLPGGRRPGSRARARARARAVMRLPTSASSSATCTGTRRGSADTPYPATSPRAPRAARTRRARPRRRDRSAATARSHPRPRGRSPRRSGAWRTGGGTRGTRRRRPRAAPRPRRTPRGRGRRRRRGRPRR